MTVPDAAPIRSVAEPWLLLAAGVGVLAWSGLAPHDRLTWVLEVAPAVIAAAVILATWRRFPLSSLLLRLVLLHAVVLMIGGRYTYALAPPGEWVRDAVRSVAQSLRPAGAFHAGLRSGRRGARNPAAALAAATRASCLAFLICLHLLGVQRVLRIARMVVGRRSCSGEGADAFLGTQGDVWDTQWDMFLALVGATSGDRCCWAAFTTAA